MTKTYSKTRVLVECALMIAVGTVLANIKIYTLPNGGSVTLFSMLPFVLISFRHGVKWGLFTGFVNSLLQDVYKRQAVHIVIVQLPQIIGEPLVPDCQQTEEGGLASPLTAYQTEHDFKLASGLKGS